MAITIQIPPEIERELRQRTPDLDEATREQFLIANYQSGKLSSGDIADILSFATRQEAQRWLADRGVPLIDGKADLEQDRANLDDLLGPGRS